MNPDPPYVNHINLYAAGVQIHDSLHAGRLEYVLYHQVDVQHQTATA